MIAHITEYVIDDMHPHDGQQSTMHMCKETLNVKKKKAYNK